MVTKSKGVPFLWLGIIVVLATGYVWWLALGALRMQSGG